VHSDRSITRGRRWLAISLVLLATPLTACSTPPPTFTGVRIQSVPRSSEMLSPAAIDDDLHSTSPHGASLNGPHYTVDVDWIATGTSVDGRDADHLGVAPMRAPKGDRLVIVGIDPTDTYSAFGDGRVDVTLTVDGRVTRVPELPLAPDAGPEGDTVLLMISALTEAALRLRATDAGRYEELDLGTGKVITNSYDMRQSGTVTWSGSTSVRYDDWDFGPAPAELAAGPDAIGASEVASLTSYTPDLTWAPKGSAYLTVPAPGLIAETSGPWTVRYDQMHERFDDRSVFTFRTRDGRTIRASSGRRDMWLAPIKDDPASPITFVVPADTTGGTVTMNLAPAQLTVGTSSPDRRNISWTKVPKPFTLSVSLG
jgi:hypothetical protein